MAPAVPTWNTQEVSLIGAMHWSTRPREGQVIEITEQKREFPVTELSDTYSLRGTCLAQHVRGDGDGGPDGGVDSKEDHPERHASPYSQVGKLQKRQRERGEEVQERMEIKREKRETA